MPLIPSFKNLYDFHVIMQALNTTSLRHHYDHSFQMSHILCFIETKIHYASIDVHKFINLSKCSYISIHNGHGLMMMYDIHMHLNLFNIIINDDLKYILATFKINTQIFLYCLCV